MMAKGQVTESVYNPAGHVVKETDGEGNETVYSNLDQFGNARLVTDAEGDATQHTYDVLGRRASTTAVDGGVTVWEYEPGMMDPVRMDPVRMDPPQGATMHYTYQATGLVASTSWYPDSDN